MKNQLIKKLKRCIAIGFTICMLLVIPEYLIADKIARTDQNEAIICFGIMLLITIIGYSFCMSTLYFKTKQQVEKHEQEIRESQKTD